MITVDGTDYEFPCDITREAQIQASELSGMLLNKNYHNDPIGTYMQYTITMAIPVTMMAEYSELYEILSDPVAGHTFILPYNQSTIQINGRVETISDRYFKKGGVAVWRGTSFVIIANEPSKVPT